MDTFDRYVHFIDKSGHDVLFVLKNGHIFGMCPIN